VVLCSSAVRTRETLAAILPVLGDPEVLIEDALYGASADALLSRLQTVPDSAESVLLIGHNPGIGDLALALAGGGDDVALRRLREGVPTGALATLAIADGWAELRDGGASLVEYVVPRELG
jgi:phosphohistidine phosphatase